MPRVFLSGRWTNERKVIIGILELSVVRIDLVDMERDGFLVDVGSN